MGIPVKLEVFEGPLDLLLHLIDKNKIDIYDIPIVEITNQYMEYIRNRELAKRAASSPPAPPRISIMTFLSSLGSRGSSRPGWCR